MLLKGKKAVITGGTRGIGYAIAERFIEEGAVVTVFGSRQETADAAVEKLLAAHPDAKVWGRTCDLTSLDAVTEAFKAAAEDMGGLDTVVTTPASPSPPRCWTTPQTSGRRSWTSTSPRSSTAAAPARRS